MQIEHVTDLEHPRGDYTAHVGLQFGLMGIGGEVIDFGHRVPLEFQQLGQHPDVRHNRRIGYGNRKDFRTGIGT